MADQWEVLELLLFRDGTSQTARVRGRRSGAVKAGRGE